MHHRGGAWSDQMAPDGRKSRTRGTGLTSTRRRVCLKRLHHTYNWALWCFLVLLLLTQALGFVWNSLYNTVTYYYGRSPIHAPGTFEIAGTNDEPYTDRSIVCSLKGRVYKPMQLNAALESATDFEDAALSVNGYRVVERNGLELSPLARDHYTNTCDQIATTLDGMLAACRSLGYNVTTTGEYLRVVLAHTETLVRLPSTLPVLILPYWDNAIFARYAIPTDDGRGCVFRLSGKYDESTYPSSWLRGTNAAVRATKTAEWLGMPGGSWCHGWYTDPQTKTHWNSDVFSTQQNNIYGLVRRQFDTVTSTEIACDDETPCAEIDTKEWWGTDLYVVESVQWFNSISITNGKRFGLFLYESLHHRSSSNVYRLENLISNVSMVMLVFRWLVALVASHRSGATIGVGALSCARSFLVLPVVLLPRMKTILAVFFTVGCHFEGEQKSLSEAWFVVYPAIAEFVLVHFSALNLLAKLLRRRVSDVLFGPTLVVLALMHYLRMEIAESGWFEMDGRVTTVMSSGEFEALRVSDFFSYDVGYRMNGRITSLYAVKLAVMGLTFGPFVLLSDTTSIRRLAARSKAVVSAAEKSLALRVAFSGGLGRSFVHEMLDEPGKKAPSTQTPHKLQSIVPVDATASTRPSQASARRSTVQQHPGVAVVPYEVVRSGYIVLGADALVSINDWFWFMISAPIRLCGIPARHLRMVTLTLKADPDHDGVFRLSERPQMHRVTDDRFKGVGAWEISITTLR